MAARLYEQRRLRVQRAPAAGRARVQQQHRARRPPAVEHRRQLRRGLSGHRHRGVSPDSQ